MKAYAIQVELSHEAGFYLGETDTAEEMMQLIAEIWEPDDQEPLPMPSEDASAPIVIEGENGIMMYGKNPNIPLAS